MSRISYSEFVTDVVERVLEKMKEKEKEKDDAVIKGTGLYGITRKHSSAVFLKAYDNLMKEKTTWIDDYKFTMFNNILGLKIDKRVFYWDKKINNWVISASIPESYFVTYKLVKVDRDNLKKGCFYCISSNPNNSSYSLWDGLRFIKFNSFRNSIRSYYSNLKYIYEVVAR